MNDEKSDPGRRRMVLCPHCQGEIRLGVRSEIVSVEKWDAYETTQSPDWWRDGLSDEQLTLIEAANRSGLLEAFKQAVDARTNVSGAPRSIERFLITFFKTMKQNRVPYFVLQQYISEFGNHGDIQVWTGQGLCAVIAGGSVRAFAPLDVFKGTAISSISGRNSSRLGGDEQTFQAWVRTRHGYVPQGATLFLAEMRRKSIGEFAKPSLSAQ